MALLHLVLRVGAGHGHDVVLHGALWVVQPRRLHLGAAQHASVRLAQVLDGVAGRGQDAHRLARRRSSFAPGPEKCSAHRWPRHTNTATHLAPGPPRALRPPPLRRPPLEAAAAAGAAAAAPWPQLLPPEGASPLAAPVRHEPDSSAMAGAGRVRRECSGAWSELRRRLRECRDCEACATGSMRARSEAGAAALERGERLEAEEGSCVGCWLMRRRDAAAAPDAATDESRRGKAGRRASKRNTAACRGAAANVERGAATAARKVMADGRVERRQLARLSRLRACGARLLVRGSGSGGDAGAVVTLALCSDGCGSDARAVEEEKVAQTAAARRESEG